MIIVHLVHIEYIKIEIDVQILFQSIIILMLTVIYIKNALVLVINVLNQEMRQIIIVMNVKLIIYLLLILQLFQKIVMKNVILIIILMKQINIIVFHLVLLLIIN